jgi:3-hydroxy-3-methylglutaryl CoA synthase
MEVLTMIGITSYGGYIPRLRLQRSAIYMANAWISPGLIANAAGEKSVANWDEDSITMAVEAARDCISGFDINRIDAAYMASLSFPFMDRQNSGIMAAALTLKSELDSADFSSSLRSGLTALNAGVNAVQSGNARNVLVAAGDRRISKTGYTHELLNGDGAAALMLGTNNVIAEFKGACTITEDFIDHYRGDGQKFDYNWEERFVRDEGYSKIVPQAVKGVMEKAGVSGKDIDTFILPCPFGKFVRVIAGKLDIAPEAVVDNLNTVCGDTGTAHPLVMMVAALEKAKPGDKILTASFGNGCTAMLFEVTKDIDGVNGKRGVSGSLADRKEDQNYMRFLNHRGLVEFDAGMRAEANWKTSLTALYRHRKQILSMVGGKCGKCRTPQFPKAEVCVNPDCHAVGAQEDYAFADLPGEIMSYTGDLLTYTMDPPAHYGMITFEGGGRGMFDFTDYDSGSIEVGQAVRMVFRIKAMDKQRGFPQYYWKAKPVTMSEEG